MGAVNHDTQSGQRATTPIGHRTEQVSEVALALVGRVAYPAEPRLRHARRSALRRPRSPVPQGGRRFSWQDARLADHPRFDLVLDRVRQLDAAASKELDSVIRRRIVARGQHDAELGAHSGGEVGDCRCRHDAEAHDIDSAGGQSGNDGGLEKLTRSPWIAPDHRERPPVCGARAGECA